jgi:hypothetical protein
MVHATAVQLQPVARRWLRAAGVLVPALVSWTASAAPPWSIDISQADIPAAGGLIGCVQLSCHGDVPLVFAGRPRIVHVQAFLDGDAVNLAFADGGSPSYPIQFNQLHSLRVLLHRDGSGTASIGLAEPVEGDLADGSAMNDMVFRGRSPLALLLIHIVMHHRS